MAPSNDTVVYNGKRISYNRYQYEVARQNRANLDRVNALVVNETGVVLQVAKDYGQQELGGLLRVAVPSLIEKYGTINSTIALAYYNQARTFWWETKGKNLNLSRDAKRSRYTRYAVARTRGLMQYQARMPKYDLGAKSEPVIGYGMKRFAEAGFDEMDSAVKNAMTRAVGSFHRDAILYNAGLDEAVYGVQRVASANACAFCAMVAFSSYSSVSGDQLDARVADYAIDFHDHCNCTIETLYLGDKPQRPDYYDQFEEDYTNASAEAGTFNTKLLLAEVRKQTGRK